VAEARQAIAPAGSRFLGGGTNLVDLMRKGVEAPARLVDVSGLPGEIEETPDGGLLIGAAARNSAIAAHPLVRSRYPVLSRAILAGASAQIRNMATAGGNLMQRTRCMYFNDVGTVGCNKRDPGSGCEARGGFNRYHAVLGGSASCVATHPSDMCVALAALDATVHLTGAAGTRPVALTDFHRLPGDEPNRDTVLERGEMITAITIPPAPPGARSTYRKVRDRASYAFGLVSVAAELAVENGQVAHVRIALGGVGTKPWRAEQTEAALLGANATPQAFAAAAGIDLVDAEPLSNNAFKIELAQRTLAAVLVELTGSAA
jgi:xanthine dehydrogenase YagS FAD-binding subunit